MRNEEDFINELKVNPIKEEDIIVYAEKNFSADSDKVIKLINELIRRSTNIQKIIYRNQLNGTANNKLGWCVSQLLRNKQLKNTNYGYHHSDTVPA